MDIDAQQVMHEQLSAGERLLWAGRPATGLALKSSDAFMIPFSLLWGGFAIFWEYMVWRSNGPQVMLVFGSLFVCVGLYLIFGRFFVDAWIRGKTYYGVTDDRAVIVRQALGNRVQSLNLKAIPEISFNVNSAGRGTITFGPSGFGQAFSRILPVASSRQPAAPAFELIDDARQVYDMIRKAQSDK